MSDLISGEIKDLTATCRNASDNALVTGISSAVLRYQIDGAATITRTMTVTASVVNYRFVAGELTEGTMHAEIELTLADGSVIKSVNEDALIFAIQRGLS